MTYVRAIPALLLSAACSGVGSDAVAYRLATANGDSLPALLTERGGCRHLLRGGAVEFPGNETFTSTFDIEIRCPDQAPTAAPDAGTAGRVEFARDSAFFYDAAGSSTGSGMLTADSLIVQGLRHRLVYIRDH